MTRYDVFNGDADGLCALQQLRLADPADGVLVTGVKRETRLLARVSPSPGDLVTVLDVSMHANREDLLRVLDAGARVTYFDHHHSGTVPENPALDAHLSDSASVCTSLLVDEFLGGAHGLWAFVGAAGDGLAAEAFERHRTILSEADRSELGELGRLLNYNSYGETVSDLYFEPSALHRAMRSYARPQDFIAGEGIVRELRRGYAADMANAEKLGPAVEKGRCAIFVLPDAAWARRASGETANRLIRIAPDRACAVLVPVSGGAYVVSVRVPRDAACRADTFCLRFETGGGRAAAGGVTRLPERDLEAFLQEFCSTFS